MSAQLSWNSNNGLSALKDKELVSIIARAAEEVLRELLKGKAGDPHFSRLSWFIVPERIYFGEGILQEALAALKHLKKAFIVSDEEMVKLGYVERVTKILDGFGASHIEFCEVVPDPPFDIVEKGLNLMKDFQPDAVVAIGGGSPIDAAKVMRLMYEFPDLRKDELLKGCIPGRKNIWAPCFDRKKAVLIAIPTTSGTGAEVTPFAVITEKGVKHPIVDYALTPDMAIVDGELVASMPKKLIAFSGMDAVSHAVEAYVSLEATAYTDALAEQAVKLLFKHLPLSYKGGVENSESKMKVHTASTIAGMAFGNAMLGICHSMAHRLGEIFHIPHGLANALMLSHVINYNAGDIKADNKKTEQKELRAETARRKYAELADCIGLGGIDSAEKTKNLINSIEELKRACGIPPSIKEAGIEEKEFYANLEMMAVRALEDPCTDTNPRRPSLEDIKKLYIDAFRGN